MPTIDKAIVYDGFDGAIVGAIVHLDSYKIVYDRDLMLSILMERDGLSYINAQDYLCFNVDDMYVGEFTPIIWEDE